MKERIELHDSSVKDVVVSGNQITISFDSFVILNITDDFGFEFDNTRFTTGKMVLNEARFESLPTAGRVFGGNLNIGECQYGLLPIDLNVSKPCVLFIEQESGAHQVFGAEIRIQID